MALNDTYPVLDGIAPSWADITVKIATLQASPLIDMRDIAEISSDGSVEVGEQRAAGQGDVIQRTTGSTKYSASMKLYYSGFNKFLDALAAVAPARPNGDLVLSLVHFNIQMLWTPPGATAIFERWIVGCRFTGDSLGAKEGNDAQQIDVALNPLRVYNVRNGKKLVLL